MKKKFRDLYKNRLESGFNSILCGNYDNFDAVFKKTLAQVEFSSKNAGPKKPRTFNQSEKSVKSVKGSGLIETKTEAKQRKEREAELTESDIQANLAKLKGKMVRKRGKKYLLKSGFFFCKWFEIYKYSGPLLLGII